ncbi:unannotated protein [freshwater metagenome]|uniref:Unannotated protein n=1 Tax=freshwater metagenome TaxID=449393 RepID=A0A6J6FY94_9ZZZZ|nr:hypothetical protein [Actinomycetota bacterium]
MTKHRTQIAIIGAALSANKGAAAMVETVMARMPQHVGPCSFDILTTYPKDDSPRVPASADARVVGMEPLRLALIEFPIACLAFLCRLLHLPLFWVRTRVCRSFLNSDVVVDVAGISFVDGRGFPILVYNTLMTGVPLLLGVPTVKAAQALGPFKNSTTNFAARLVLPRVTAICARGARTREHLDSLGLTNVFDVSDLAFSLEETGEIPEQIRKLMQPAGEEFVVVMPSSVVKGLFEKDHGSYAQAMAELVKQIRSHTTKGVVIVPHSYRSQHPEGRMNDGPICKEVAQLCAHDPMVVGIDADLTAGELRHIVSLGSVLVTSRFHAMISGLSTCTPTVVIGWSHKYKEVLDDFGLAELGHDSSALLHPGRLAAVVSDVLQRSNEISFQIRNGLPAVQERSARNFSIIAGAIKP